MLFAKPRLPEIVFAALTLASSASCGSSTTTSLSPSPVGKCQVTATSGQSTIDAAGGVGSVTVSAAAECGWTATVAANWISGLTPASGQGSAEITFHVALNPTGATRQADISLNGATARVTQTGATCGLQITPRRQAVPVNGGTGTVAVTTLPGCSWTVTSNATWLTAIAGGTGAGTVSFSVAANEGAARNAALTIGTEIFVVTQAALGDMTCGYSLQPETVSVGPSGGRRTVALQTGPGCSWTAFSDMPWLTVEGAASGNGNASVSIRASANTGAARTGTVTIAGQTLTVSQSGPAATPPGSDACSPTIDPLNQALPASGGTASPVEVTAPSGCEWTATATVPWLTITAGRTGIANGVVGFAVAPNDGPARTGTISIAGQTHTVSQAASCSYSINPTSQTFKEKAATSDPVSVTAAQGCAWTATSNDDWITVKSGASGTGNGTMKFTVSRNSGDTRVGTLTIAGQRFTVTQTGN